MPRFNRFAAATAIAAALSLLAAAPASARDHHRWHRHHDGIDGGDVLAGVLILGGIAAVASAVDNNNDRDREYRDYPPPPPPQGRYEQRYDYRGAPPQQGSSTGLDRAADICANAVGTNDPVGSVDSVRRGPSGWDVDGTLQDGSPFACSIGNDGQVRDIHTGGEYDGATYDEGGNPDQSYGDDGPYDEQSYNDPADGQYDDDTYVRLRAQQDGLGG